MAAVDLRKVRQVLREKLLTVPGIPATALHEAENRPIVPPGPETPLWIREKMVPIAEPLVATGQTRTRGYMQWDVVAPAGRGTEEVEDLTTAILATFKRQVLNSQGIQVYIYDTDRAQGRKESEIWWSKPVFVYWAVHAIT
jgi:hypothetical protein